MATAQVIQFPVIPRKPVRHTKTYRCPACGHQVTFPWRVSHAVYCEYGYGRSGNCGAEMRPVYSGTRMEAK